MKVFVRNDSHIVEIESEDGGIDGVADLVLDMWEKTKVEEVPDVEEVEEPEVEIISAGPVSISMAHDRPASSSTVFGFGVVE